jgi:hypothetical protein
VVDKEIDVDAEFTDIPIKNCRVGGCYMMKRDVGKREQRG